MDFRAARELDDAERIQREVEDLELARREARLVTWFLGALVIAPLIPAAIWILAR